MFYTGLIVVIALLALIGLALAVKLLIKGQWLLGFLRGILGIGLLAMVALFALAAMDIFSYKQVLSERPIGTIALEKQGTQHYRLILSDIQGNQEIYDIYGDQWQLDARLIKWTDKFSALGAKPAYRLERLSGRYFSLDQERNAERSLYTLSQSPYGVDLWSAVKIAGGLPWVDAVYGNASFVPMADGALYEVSLSHSGLVTRPLNEHAQAAVTRWQ